MKIVVFGNKVATTEFIQHLLDAGERPHTVVTLSPDQKRRGVIAGVDLELASFAAANELQVYTPSGYGLRDPKDFDFFERENFSIGFCLGWQRLIPSPILEAVSHGVFGWHGSCFKFPHGRGRSPLNWSIRLGADRVFHNCFRYSSGVDDGQVFGVSTLMIEPEDYIADLQKKAQEHIKESALQILRDLRAGIICLTSQPDSVFLEFPKLTEQDGLLQPKLMERDQARNIVRSCSKPFPGAFVNVRGEKFMRIWRMQRIEDVGSVDAGTLLYSASEKPVLGFSDGSMAITDYDVLNHNVLRDHGEVIDVD